MRLSGLLATIILFAAGASAGISGEWTFEAKTSDGVLKARLVLEEKSEVLAGAMWVDGHVLKGEGHLLGDTFELVLEHADGSGPGHEQQIRLTGSFDGEQLRGRWSSKEESGTWIARRTARRQQHGRGPDDADRRFRLATRERDEGAFQPFLMRSGAWVTNASRVG